MSIEFHHSVWSFLYIVREDNDIILSFRLSKRFVSRKKEIYNFLIPFRLFSFMLSLRPQVGNSRSFESFILCGILISFTKLITKARSKSCSFKKEKGFLLSPHLHTVVNWISLMYEDRFDKNLQRLLFFPFFGPKRNLLLPNWISLFLPGSFIGFFRANLS